MKSKFVTLLVFLMSSSLLAPAHVFANSAGKNEITDAAPISSFKKPISYRSERITKPGDDSCFIDIFNFGNTTTLRFGSGVTQTIKRGPDQRIESISTNGIERRIHYESANKGARVIGIESANGVYKTAESIKNHPRRKIAAPRMSPSEVMSYINAKIERMWCASPAGAKKIALMNVDSEEVPEELLDTEYWEQIVVTAPPYDPVCNEADCVQFATDWRDLALVNCGLAALVFWFNPIAAALVAAACTGGTLYVYSERRSDCSAPAAACY
jgi:hypothetical protein